MMYLATARLIIAVVLLVSALAPSMAAPSTAIAEECDFVLGFKTLREMIPDEVGECLTDVHYSVESGDGLQETT